MKATPIIKGFTINTAFFFFQSSKDICVCSDASNVVTEHQTKTCLFKKKSLKLLLEILNFFTDEEFNQPHSYSLIEKNNKILTRAFFGDCAFISVFLYFKVKRNVQKCTDDRKKGIIGIRHDFI